MAFKVEFVVVDPMSMMSYNKLYVEAFVEAVNSGDFQKHALVPGQEHVVRRNDDYSWQLGLKPVYSDGRITTRRTAWVYAKKVEGAKAGEPFAMVFFTTEKEPIGYLVREGV